ncbi:hypothetical protein [Epibacterium ulvae]|uniref:hypothetical protein n=1 Tax=Epibacterium ulvae TaxID=1156985 RepID=UPI00248FFACF|nr:hypothetical protein [Epibacterium ulvae]
MRRLVLHIGTHKTGSTSLQKSLLQGQQDKTLGPWSYIHARPRVDMNPLVACKGMGPQLRAQLRMPFLERRLENANQRGFEDCVISTEMLFWLHDEREIRTLAERLRQEFDDIRIVVYLRRQDLLALSHRKQVILGQTAYQFYGAQVQALPSYRPYFMRYMDYASKLEKWQRVFGTEALTVRRYQPQDLHGGDTVLDFRNILGLPAPEQPAERLNTAWNRTQILTGLWLRQRGYPRSCFMPSLRALEDPEKLTPSRAQARAFLRRFEKVNETLAQRYDPEGPTQFFSPDFTNYPEMANDGYDAPRPDLKALEEEVQAQMKEQGLKLETLNPNDRN